MVSNTVNLTFVPLLFVWLIWVAYWCGSWAYEFFRGKREKIIKVKRGPDGLLLLFSLILVLAPFTSPSFFTIMFIPAAPAISYVGIAIAAVGILFSIWARHHIGTNWSSVPALRKNQALVRTGPYSIVRHPIYTGVLFGIIGSAIAVGEYRGLIAIIVIIVFCWNRIRDEEKLMSDEFGKQYDDYKKEVRMIIPFIF